MLSVTCTPYLYLLLFHVRLQNFDSMKGLNGCLTSFYRVIFRKQESADRPLPAEL
jgi:hypothetical protein